MTRKQFEGLEPGQLIAVFINGYGAQTDPANHPGLTKYLNGVFAFIREHDLDVRIEAIYLCGGSTNRKMTEARSMMRWIEVHEPEWVRRIRLVEDSTTGRDNVIEFTLRSGADRYPILFCEYSRRFTVKMFAWHFLRRPRTVVGLAFDEDSLKPAHQLKQLVFGLAVEFLSLHVPLVDKLRVAQRKRHVKAAQEQARQEDTR